MHVQNFREAHPASCTIGSMAFPGVKRPGRGADLSPSSSAEFAKGLELYFLRPSVPA